MNDCYMPIERKLKLTRQALEVITQYRFPVHMMTKSDLVLRDIDLLNKIKNIYTAVSFTITTPNDKLAKIVEPGAPPPSSRYKAIKKLSDEGIYTGITMTPILPFIEDTEENITELVEQAHHAGAKYILAWFGMTLRDRQRAYYYKKLDKHFPGLKQRYQKAYGDNYSANSPNAQKLNQIFKQLCKKYGIQTKMDKYKPPKEPKQLGLLSKD